MYHARTGSGISAVEEFVSLLVSGCRYALRTLRVFNIRSMILFYLIGQSLAHVPFRFSPTIRVILLFFLMYSFASLLNYAEDVHMDTKNNRFTPVSSFLSPSQVRYIATLFLLGALILTLFLHTLLFWSMFLLFTTSALLYSSPWAHWSHRPFPKLMLMSLLYAIIPLCAGINDQLPFLSLVQWITISSLIVFYSSWLIYTDIKDIVGDQAYGKITLVVRYGIPKSMWGSAIAGGMGVMGIGITQGASPFLFTQISVIVFIVLWLFQVLAAWSPSLILRPRIRMIGGYLLLVSLLWYWVVLTFFSR